MEIQIRGFDGKGICYVNLFYLIPEFRGKGLGKDLIRYAEDFFRKSLVTGDHLRNSPTNELRI
ncbi:GNAT family N-acetyltransferase [Cytobacillus praedii]|uniref:N-acetyltransferase n=1 Tax=Cytobacillus praedii TaxID=1742358 RepID=A0A4R1AT96_9BACI|nr:N-acetyltransferase [Cytobacillus praedii]